MDNVIIIVIAPPRDPEKELLKELSLPDDAWSYVSINSNGVPNSESLQKDIIFLLINQEQESDKISNILNSVKKVSAKAIVYTHGNPTHLGAICYPSYTEEEIENCFNDRLLNCEIFSHVNIESKPYLLFMKQYRMLEWDENKNLLDLLVRSYTLQKVHSLRTEILTPLVALDLVQQAKINIDEINGLNEAIQSIKNCSRINELCKLLEEKGLLKQEENKQLNDNFKLLIENTECNTQVYHEDLKVLAEVLENKISILEGNI